MAKECVSDIACINFLTHIPCVIDLVEPFITVDGDRIDIQFVLESGRRYEFDFTYKVGYPAGNRFGLFFFQSPEAVNAVLEHRADPETTQITMDQPMLINFNPRVPGRDTTGVLEQEGTLTIEMPELEEELESDEKIFYYGILAMYQPEEA